MCAAGWIWGACLSAKVTVELQPYVTARNVVVRLHDIAQIKDEGELSEKEVMELKEIVVDTFPSLDAARVIPAFRIKRFLERAGYEGFEIVGLQSKVHVETRTVSLKELEAAIEHWAQQRFSDKYSFNIRYERLPHEWKIPADEEMTFEVSGPSHVTPGACLLVIKAINHDQIASTAQAKIYFNVYQEAVILTRKVDRGSVISPDDVAVQRVELARSKVQGSTYENVDQVIGQIAKKDLQANEVIFKSVVEPPILITKGSMNRVEIINGEISMNMPSVRALENGRSGETIAFENPMNSTSKLYASVIQKGYAVLNIS
jgi:flagella basal body P-ring formation protein FlgA